MPSKRAPPSEGSGHQNKKQKFTKTRSIVVQEPGTPSQPSKSNAPNELPNSIDVEAFTESRSFEIKAMQQAMKSAKYVNVLRIASFISHLILSGPGQRIGLGKSFRVIFGDGLRVTTCDECHSAFVLSRAQKWILGAEKSLDDRSPNSERVGVNIVVISLNGDKDKKWLETHLWHAKRMHMENMWGYRLAVRPTEKSFRPSHRASVHGSILHDASYYDLIELTGAQVVLSRTLETCCDPAGARPASKRFMSGIRGCETGVYEVGSYPFRFIGPVSIIWRAMRAASSASQSSDALPTESKSKGKRKHKQKKENSHQPETPDDEIRTVWIRCHPAIFSSVQSTLKQAVSSTLDALTKSPTHSKNSYAVEVIDLRDSINIFEITGPKSSQVICGALTPTIANHSGEFKKFWSSLSDLQSTGSIPSNMVVGFTVLDPRLNFPPKNARAHMATEDLPTISKPWECFPTASLAWSDIWDQSVRDAIETPRFTKKELDARREQNVVPGTSLKPTVSDDRVPVLLIQRSVKPASTSSTSLSTPHSTQSLKRSTKPDPNLHGWTLVVPKGWGMPFLTSLIYTGTRVAGQREREHQAFEAGATYFPRDFPTCTAYEQFAAARAIKDKERWKKKPPAKRVSWGKLSTLSPWTSAWRVALGLDPAPSGEEGADDGSDEDVVPTQRDDTAPTSDPASSPAWLLHGSRARTIVEHVSRLLSPASGLLSEINALRRKCELPPLDDADALLQGALMHVRVLLCGRGALDDMAFIYALEDPEARAWAAAHGPRALVGYEVGEEPTDATELSKVVPSDSALIGFVTSGKFSLSRGKGYAIGAISLTKFLEIREQAHRLRRENDWMVKVRNRDGMICRAARVDFLE